MAEEKNSQPVQGYPDVPPPSYPVSSNGPVPVQPVVLVPNQGAATTPNNPAFVAIPAARYDTMTSYTEDGTGVRTFVPSGAVLDYPILMHCPFCKNAITTETKPVSGALTWLCCLGLCLVGLSAGCCLIPFFGKRFRDIRHYCPRCHNLVALYKRL